MIFRASEIARVVGGELAGPDLDVDGARHDSREIVGGELFVPLKDQRDGHDFIDFAIEAGAAAYLTARDPQGATAIRVADPAAALAALGVHARVRLPNRVIAITGSVGKTSCKDLAASVLGVRYTAHASLRSFNNELGVPLTLANAPGDTEVAIIEMGARGLGHIEQLCAIAMPTIGIVTNVEHVHTSVFGDLEQVAQAKGELVDHLPPSGTAILNADNPLVAAMAARCRGRVVRFGSGDADVRAEQVTIDPDLHASFRLRTSWGDTEVRLGIRGEHQILNALAAAAAGLVCNVSLDEVSEGLAEAELSPWRMELVTTASGLVVLNDAYNAGPASMEAALRALAHLSVSRRIAVLGPMAELGHHAAPAHRRIAELAASHDIVLLAVGAPDYGEGPGLEHIDDIDAALARLEAMGPFGADDAVLVKGSRVAGLERLAQRLVDRVDD